MGGPGILEILLKLAKGRKKKSNETPTLPRIFQYILYILEFNTFFSLPDSLTPSHLSIARILQIANANLHDFAHAVRKESNSELQRPTVVKATSPTSCDPPPGDEVNKISPANFGGDVDFVDWKVVGQLL